MHDHSIFEILLLKVLRRGPATGKNLLYQVMYDAKRAVSRNPKLVLKQFSGGTIHELLEKFARSAPIEDLFNILKKSL